MLIRLRDTLLKAQGTPLHDQSKNAGGFDIERKLKYETLQT